MTASSHLRSDELPISEFMMEDLFMHSLRIFVDESFTKRGLRSTGQIALKWLIGLSLTLVMFALNSAEAQLARPAPPQGLVVVTPSTGNVALPPRPIDLSGARPTATPKASATPPTAAPDSPRATPTSTPNFKAIPTPTAGITPRTSFYHPAFRGRSSRFCSL
jgi:hypothetical protein